MVYPRILRPFPPLWCAAGRLRTRSAAITSTSPSSTAPLPTASTAASPFCPSANFDLPLHIPSQRIMRHPWLGVGTGQLAYLQDTRSMSSNPRFADPVRALHLQILDRVQFSRILRIPLRPVNAKNVYIDENDGILLRTAKTNGPPPETSFTASPSDIFLQRPTFQLVYAGQAPRAEIWQMWGRGTEGVLTASEKRYQCIWNVPRLSRPRLGQYLQ